MPARPLHPSHASAPPSNSAHARWASTTLSPLQNVHILHDNLNLTVSPAVRPALPSRAPLPQHLCALTHPRLSTPTAQEAALIEGQAKATLLKASKLSLVIDLDQTILHATVDPAINSVIAADPECAIHRIALPEAPNDTYFIKLRPGLVPFLEELQRSFELHIYTMGSKSYAKAVVRLFDPDGRFFYDRILTRDDAASDTLGDCFNRKCLKRIFPTDDSTVVVIDDRADVWDYCDNLIPVHPCMAAAKDFPLPRQRPPSPLLTNATLPRG